MEQKSQFGKPHNHLDLNTNSQWEQGTSSMEHKDKLGELGQGPIKSSVQFLDN